MSKDLMEILLIASTASFEVLVTLHKLQQDYNGFTIRAIYTGV
jgi:hypothetical protein